MDVPAISLMAVPDFIAGFVYGMVQDNQLQEIESCAQGWEIMYDEIETGIADIEKGGVDYDIQAALEFALVILQIPTSLDTCRNMDEDIAAIKSWSQIFTNPAQLAAVVSKNFLFHHDAIVADANSLTTDWNSTMYFQSGEDLAQLMIDLIGPIQMENSVEINAMAVPQFIAGFVYGMVQDNQLEEIESCAQGWESMLPEIEAGIADIQHGGVDYDIQAALQFALVILQIPTALDTCKLMTDDITAIETWAQIFTNPTQLAAVVSKNLLLHHNAISADATALTTDWTAQSYYTAGEDLAQLMIDLVGPIETAESVFLQ